MGSNFVLKSAEKNKEKNKTKQNKKTPPPELIRSVHLNCYTVRFHPFHLHLYAFTQKLAGPASTAS